MARSTPKSFRASRSPMAKAPSWCPRSKSPNLFRVEKWIALHPAIPPLQSMCNPFLCPAIHAIHFSQAYTFGQVVHRLVLVPRPCLALGFFHFLQGLFE